MNTGLLKKNVSLKISTRALKAVDFRGGLDQFLIRAKNKNLAPRIKKLNQFGLFQFKNRDLVFLSIFILLGQIV